ncbi:hypothetical protein GPJ56_004556 [Histomonas meleagridis]|nr:hypothetical protein GPJ56_004556 [Histomonas meleagridis]
MPCTVPLLPGCHTGCHWVPHTELLHHTGCHHTLVSPGATCLGAPPPGATATGCRTGCARSPHALGRRTLGAALGATWVMRTTPHWVPPLGRRALGAAHRFTH